MFSNANTKRVVLPDQTRFNFTAGKIVSVIGPTGVGKSHLVAKILRDRNELITPFPTKIIYVYNIWQEDLFREIENWCPGIVTFVQGLDELQKFVFPPPSTSSCTVLVLDDQQQALLDSKDFGITLMTAGIHHNNILCFFIGQSLYLKAKHTTLVNRNSSYVIMFRNKRSMYECERMGQQALQLSSNQVRRLYKDACQYTPHCYLLYDLNPDTSEFRQLTTNILSTDSPWFFYYITEEHG
jgi:energy-coupling factor transporter ATP-binding protein EcfA2